MGTGIDNYGVIDDAFSGIAQPQRTIEMGRPDIETDRPGETLVEAVREFARDGGFRAIREERNQQRAKEESAGRAVRRESPADISLPAIQPDEPARDLTDR